MTVLDVVSVSLDILSNAIIIFSLAFVVTGVVVGLLQTVFSVQDPGLPMAAKLVVFMFLLAEFGGGIYEQFYLVFKEL
ncbi:flagellar biosynthetic protein FliQ [Vibrio parahaemolyticus]|uniref:flagellar biosynthetic protein FliQ n=1 Tax=Vibrio parahaemolyticus TaxID=670 RepID=UPI0006B28EF2|nr:flagellar biosynthetic protein FliQ [Vibrio parahaemolyticus]EJC6779792.1 flagellar biosynthetic protein FliQ [Vibrio parahaemolyticus]EJF4093533.1 flagellar biosynthetic protein FliQ [Vibrio parahaemolyticus]EJG0303208.1 flagellar biosynthetic protein FliQ [Vibrio parahaemolyticus]EJG0516513.1 flagellar biosynthetic protein FliQ [Vibrio parahaemolyticus]EKN4569902.1 flagellar biosynthetic protein FliQ [Vibrio parahaemolyticus]